MTPSLTLHGDADPAPRFAGCSAPMLETLKLHHLRTPAQIAAVLPLRGEIDLSVHAAAGRDFTRLEKKETRWASSSGSSTRAG